MNTDSIVKKIVALFALADPTRNANPGERENAARLAHELMEKYSIDVNQIDAAKGETGNKFCTEPANGKRLSAVPKCERYLANAVANLLGLHPVLSTGAMLFCGERHIVAIGQELHAVLKISMNKAARLFSKSARKQTKFRNGFGAGVLHQVGKLNPSPSVIERAEWSKMEAERKLNLVPSRAQKMKKSKAFFAGVARGVAQNIGYETNLNANQSNVPLLCAGN